MYLVRCCNLCNDGVGIFYRRITIIELAECYDRCRKGVDKQNVAEEEKQQHHSMLVGIQSKDFRLSTLIYVFMSAQPVFNGCGKQDNRWLFICECLGRLGVFFSEDFLMRICSTIFPPMGYGNNNDNFSVINNSIAFNHS